MMHGGCASARLPQSETLSSWAIGILSRQHGRLTARASCSLSLVGAVESVLLSDVTEVRDGFDQLSSRATTPEVADAMFREMALYDAYLE